MSLSDHQPSSIEGTRSGSQEAAVMHVLERVNQGFHDRDAEAIKNEFVEEAVIFDLGPPLKHALTRETLETWFKGWRGPVERQMRDMKVVIEGDLAFVHGLYQVSAVTTAGHNASWWMRATVCLRQTDGWRIVHEHTSVPFHMDGSFRAATDLEP